MTNPGAGSAASAVRFDEMQRLEEGLPSLSGRRRCVASGTVHRRRDWCGGNGGTGLGSKRVGSGAHTLGPATSTMKLLLATPIAPSAIAQLQEDHEVVLGFEENADLASLIADREGLIFRSGVTISREIIEAGRHLRLIVRAGSGLDNIDLDAARERGIRVARVPGASPQAVAELAVGLLLAASRNIAAADSLIRQGRWPKRDLGGPLVDGKTMGIVGAGRIGGRTGALCAALGMRVLGCVEHPGADAEKRLRGQGLIPSDFDTVVSESDYVSVHTPLKESTRFLIDDEAIAKMKPGAVLINTARGGIVDETAVAAALHSGHLSAAAFDVHEVEGDGVIPELAAFPNVVLTPHIGGMALETQSMIGMRVAEIVAAFLAGRLDETLTADEFVL